MLECGREGLRKAEGGGGAGSLLNSTGGQGKAGDTPGDFLLRQPRVGRSSVQLVEL
jgi:hypothetical protein